MRNMLPIVTVKQIARRFGEVSEFVAPGHEPNNGITEVEIPVAELPSGKNLTIAVRPVSSLGTKGTTIGTKYKA